MNSIIKIQIPLLSINSILDNIAMQELYLLWLILIDSTYKKFIQLQKDFLKSDEIQTKRAT